MPPEERRYFITVKEPYWNFTFELSELHINLRQQENSFRAANAGRMKRFTIGLEINLQVEANVPRKQGIICARINEKPRLLHALRIMRRRKNRAGHRSPDLTKDF